MWVRVRRESKDLPEEWINIANMENIEFNSDDNSISFFGKDEEYAFEDMPDDDFLAVKNAMMGIKPIYQKVNENAEETVE